MHLLLWEYRVKPALRAEFESVYGPQGAWAALFRREAGYAGTELLRDTGDTQRYVTIDRWASPEAYQRFRARWPAEYAALDERCGALTEAETFLGAFTAPAD